MVLSGKWKDRSLQGGENTNYSMKDANGSRINIASSEAVPQDLTGISMNLDEFDGTIELLTSQGFVIVNGGKVTDPGSSKSVFMMAPSGFCISVVKHIK